MLVHALRATSLSVLALVVLACHKEPDPEASSGVVKTPQPPRGSGGVDAPRPSTTSGCVIPLPETPAPRATAAPNCPPDPGEPPPLPRGFVTFEGSDRAPRVEVEIADSAATRERGLMYRTSMPEDRGMLFSWPTEAPRAFWMHNTCIPLDMLFIAEDGTIAGIVEEVPVMNDEARSIPCPAAHVLELVAGWSRAHGVAPGQKIRIER